jgi:nicotinamidase-related amidase
VAHCSDDDQELKRVAIEEPVQPTHTALLVMDYQPAILQMLSAPDELLGQVEYAIATARQRGTHIGYVRVALDDDDYNNVPAHSRMAAVIAARGRMFDSDSPTTQIHERLAPQGGDIVVRKSRVSAFSTTDLDQQLRDGDVDTLILCGISTSGVVLSTVRDAHDRDYQIFVLSDCCADLDLSVHEFLMDKIFPRQAQIITTTDLPDLLASR